MSRRIRVTVCHEDGEVISILHLHAEDEAAWKQGVVDEARTGHWDEATSDRIDEVLGDIRAGLLQAATRDEDL